MAAIAAKAAGVMAMRIIGVAIGRGPGRGFEPACRTWSVGLSVGLTSDIQAKLLKLLNRVVPLAGIEPALLAESDFESDASTSSAIGARLEADGGI